MSDNRRSPPKGLPGQTPKVVGIKPSEPGAERSSGEMFFGPGDIIPNRDDVIYFVLSGSVIIRRVVQTPNGPGYLTYPPSSQGDAFNEGVVAEGATIGGTVTRVRDKEHRLEYVAETHVRLLGLTAEQTLNTRNPKFADMLYKLFVATIRKKSALEEQVEYHHGQTLELRHAQTQAALEAERENETLRDELETANDKIAHLERDLAASLEREKTARRGSAAAFEHLQTERERQAAEAKLELERRAKQLSDIWRQLERVFARVPQMSLPEETMSALLGLDPNTANPMSGDVGQAIDDVFNGTIAEQHDEDIYVDVTDGYEEIPDPLLPPLPGSRERLPTMVGPAPVSTLKEIMDEPTEVGLGPLPGVARPPAKSKTGFGGLLFGNRAKPQRTLTPAQFAAVGAPVRPSQIPKAPPPPVTPEPPPSGRLNITVPGSNRNPPIPREEPDGPDIETEEVGHFKTANWGLAENLGTAPKPKR